MGINFFITENSIGMRRDEACIKSVYFLKIN